MNSLIFDTLKYLRQNGYVYKKPPLPSNSPLPPKSHPKPQKQAIALEPSPNKIEKPAPSLFTAIEKHLPHIVLRKEVAKPQVAIFISEDYGKSFFENFAKAIQERFCPVQLFFQKKPSHWSPFYLVFSQEKIEGISDEQQILLAKASFYENNSEEKKNLWAKVCQLLKSS